MKLVELEVHNESGDVVGTVAFDEKLLGEKVRRRLLHQAILMYQANVRRGTHSTKTRGERKGSGRKPWRQKGTGRARVGSIRSPIWRKGGVIFGPRPRSYTLKMPKQARREALKSALLARFLDGDVKVLDALAFEVPKTRRLAATLRALGVTASCLLTTWEHNPTAYLSARNIPGAELLRARNLNAYAVLRPQRLVMTRDVIENLNELVRT